MEIDAKPAISNIVLVNDKFLMALLGSHDIKPVHVFSSGWPSNPEEYTRKLFMAYRETDQIKHLIKTFENRTVTVNLDAYLMSEDELNAYQVGHMKYKPVNWEEKDNG